MNPETFRLHSAQLRVADLGRSHAFYGDILELAEGPDAPLQFIEIPGAAPKPQGAPGLFHVALLVPDRPSLARVLRRLVEKRVPLHGLSDHGVSEAIYLADPDGNGLEIYADRPRETWTTVDGKLAMFTARLDVDDLVATAPDGRSAGLPANTVLGHVHLSVRALPPAKDFYTGPLGLDVMTDEYPGALFFGADGYHHHIAANTWGRTAAASRLTPEELRTFAGLESIRACTHRVKTATTLTDADGIRVELKPL